MTRGCGGGGGVSGGIGGGERGQAERVLSCAGNSNESRATSQREAEASYLPTRLPS